MLQKSLLSASRLLLVLVLALGACAEVTWAAPAWKEVYDPFIVRTFYLELPPSDWDRVRHDQPIEGQTEGQERAQAWFHSEGESPIRVEIRRKGATDPALPNDGNPQKVSLKIDFNAVVPGQEWHGLRKLSLDNGGDGGALHEGFAWQVHRMAAEAGFYRYDAANSAWAKVYINGSYTGVYASTEQRDEQMLRNRDLYSPFNTWLYKIDGGIYLEVGTGDSPTHAHLNFAPFKERNGGAVPDLAIDLPQWIDMESMLTLAACETFVENNDGLLTHSGKNSFCADFNPPNLRRRIYFPWDMDASIKQGTTGIYGNDAYQTQLLGNAWFGRVYEHILRELLAGPLSAASIHVFLNQLEPVLAPVLETDPYAPSGSSAFASLRNWATTRNANVATRFLHPYVARPSFSHPGGEVISGSTLAITAPAGQIYYTTNGVDPRALNGSVASGAVLFSAPVLIDRGMKVIARALNGANWSGLATEASFQIATATIPLRFSEIMYHPLDPNPGDTIDKDAYEFLELFNTSASAFHVSEYFFDGITYTFPAGSVIAAGARVVLVRNATTFAARYPGVSYSGIFLGSLSNSGEKIRLKRPDGTTVISVEYDDDPPWVLSPDGLGYSLVNRNPDGDPDEAANWRASRDPGGSPGAGDTLPAYALDVIINEVLANTAAPYDDAVELQNTGASGADIGGWYLSDEARNATGDLVPALLKKYQVPAGTVVPAGGYAVLYEGAFLSNNPLVPFSLSPQGGRVYLSSADAAENLTGNIVALEFPATDLNSSYGRVATSDGTQEAPLATPTFGVSSPASVAAFRGGGGAANSAPRVGPVVLSEIMYNPVDTGSEFVELHNVSVSSVDISGWDIDGIAAFAFPAGTAIPPGGFVVLVDTQTTTVAAFRATFAVPAEAQVFGHSFDLGNAGESLRLEKPNPVALQPDILVEKVRFNDKAPWPTEADGLGPSLERLPPGQSGYEPLNWRAVTMHGTPGRLGTAASGVAIAKGSFWDFKAVAAGLGTVWKESAYNATGWDSADGPTGYGETFLASVIPYGPDAAAKYPTTYFRKPFVIQDSPAAIATLRLSMLYDDGVVVYLNGTEVARRGMPEGTIDYATMAEADREATQYEEIDLGAFKNVLVQGTNLLAVEVHQFGPASADLVWDADLTFTVAGPPSDADNDGLPGDWETANGLSDAHPTDALLDSDNDGQNNLAEYHAGTDPRNPYSVLRFDTVMPAAGGGLLLSWGSVPGKSYRVTYSPDMLEWFSFGAEGDVTSTGPVAQFIDLSASFSSQRFYRTSVVSPP